MEWALGVLIYAGHDVDDMLDRYSMQQLCSHAGWVMRYQVDTLNMLMAPLAGMMGHKWNPAKTDGPQPRQRRDPKHHKNADYTDPEAKDKALMAAIGRRFRVRDVPASGGTDNSAG